MLSAFEVESNPNIENTSTDVLVEMKDGRRYVATFYSQQCLDEKLSEYRNGNPSEQHYIWFQNLIVVRLMEESHIALIVNEMIEEGDFQLIFKKID